MHSETRCRTFCHVRGFVVIQEAFQVSLICSIASVHLSRETITKGEHILARAGLFDLEQTVVEQNNVGMRLT